MTRDDSKKARDAWRDPAIVANYGRRSYILPAEVRAFKECSAHIADGHILDIGVGAGRTIPFVEPGSSRYVAIDRSPVMVSSAQAKFPHADIRVEDVLSLPFGPSEFSFALFSFNGIDYVTPHERPKALREIARVLRPNGRFVFSTHNLRARENAKSRFELQAPQLSTNPLRTLVRSLRAVRDSVVSYRNFRRLREFEQAEQEVAYLNDGAHQYSFLTCYISPPAQIRALDEAGFDTLLLIGEDGQDATVESNAPWLHFVARKR